MNTDMATYTPTEQEVKDRRRFKLSALMSQTARPYINSYTAGVLLGVVLFMSFLVTGSGLGASGGLNRFVVYVEDAIVPDHVNNTAYLASMAGGDLNPLDSWIVFVTLGTIAGGFVSGLVNGRTKLETVRGPQVSVSLRWVLAFVGGAAMGFGARLARGCTSGQALSGGAVLSVGSWLFMFAVFGGAYALAYFLRRVWN